MKKWLRRARAALLMGLIWAVVWLPVGLLIGLIVAPDGSTDKPWILVAGFRTGVVFSGVLGFAARNRRFNELSISRFAALGALAGLLIGALPFVMADRLERPPWLLAVVVISSVALLGAVTAAGSLVLARMAEKRERRAADADVAEVGLTQLEKQELLVLQ